MRNLIHFIKSIKIKQVLTVFLAGSLLVISTACSQGSVAQGANKVEAAMSDTYDKYDANQDYKGGMNGYNDDRRYDAGDTAKVKGLVDTANNRQRDSLGEYADDITDRAGNKIEQAKQDIPSELQANKEKAVDYVQDKSDKLTDNLGQVPNQTQKVVEEATDTALNALDDAAQATKSNAKEIKDNFQDLS